MTGLTLIFFATFFLSYSNGSNDNFKGVATLFGSGTADYKKCIWLATIATFAGSISAVLLAETLVKTFSGKGLVPDATAISPEFLVAVALGAGLTVIIATFTGFPISTTHSLTGALFGGGLAAIGSAVNFEVLGRAFFIPLLLSPLIAIVLAMVCYLIFRHIRKKMGITKEWCICVGNKVTAVGVQGPASTMEMGEMGLENQIDVNMDTMENCLERYSGNMLGVGIHKLLDLAHFMSAGIVSFARGLNDTPKIAALLVSAKAIGIEYAMIAVGFGMAIGGLISARKVANTMSKKITPLNHGQGFTANLVTGILVIFASKFGVPVSTTHVSVGSILGIGAVTGEADPKVVSEVLMSWLLTLPLSAALSASTYWLLTVLN